MGWHLTARGVPAYRVPNGNQWDEHDREKLSRARFNADLEGSRDWVVVEVVGR